MARREAAGRALLRGAFRVPPGGVRASPDGGRVALATADVVLRAPIR